MSAFTTVIGRNLHWLVIALASVMAIGVGWLAHMRNQIRLRLVDLKRELAARQEAEDALAASEATYPAIFENVNDQDLVLTILEDVSEHRNADEALLQSEHKYRTLYLAMNEGVALHDVIYDEQGNPVDYQITDVNRSYETITGLSRAQATAGPASQVYGHSPPPYLDIFTRVAETQTPILFETYYEDMQKHFSISVFSPARGKFGTVFADVTDARNAEEALRRSEEDLRITLDSIGDAVIATDAEECIVRMNPVACELTAWSVEEARGRNLAEIFQIVNAHTRKTVESPALRVLREGQIVGLANHTVLIARDGTERQIADSGAPIRDADGNTSGVVLVFRDVTEEYALQEQLRQSQKLEAIGQLAGGIAHDFNNLLGGIMGYAGLIEQTVPEDSEPSQFAKTIINTSKTAAELTSQLLAFSRRGKLEEAVLDVHRTITSVGEILGHTIDPRIQIETRLEADPSLVLGDPSQLQNAVLNLAINARDAMPEGGVLTISTSNVYLDESFSTKHAFFVAPGPFIQIEIADTGLGMDREVQARIFEPFFTTKEMGRGTGLGLAAVYGTMKSHGGAISVYSEVGKGTAFKLYVPAARSGESGAVNLSPEPTAASFAGTGEILLIDDEPTIREVGKRILEGVGYTVTTAEDGSQGVEALRDHKDSVVLVLLDMIMPVLNGPDTYHRMREIAPGVPVLLMTGYSVSDEVNALLTAGALGVIQKPFRAVELLRHVHGILAAVD